MRPLRSDRAPRRSWERGSHLVIAAIFVLLVAVGCSGGSDDPVAPPLVLGLDGVLYNVAGFSGEAGNDGDGGPAADAYLYWVIDLTVLPNGELLVMDWNNHRIRKITTDGIIHPFIGSGVLGDGVSGPALSVNFNHPTEIKIGPDGNYYVAAYHNWKVKAFSAATLECSVPVGTGRGFGGDYGPAVSSMLDLPSSLIFDAAGNMYIADQGNSRIRRVEATSGIITTFAGGVKGYADGVGEAAMFNWPGGTTTGTGARGAVLELSPDGQDVFVTDASNNRIRKLNLATRMVTTVAGTGTAGYSGDGGSALAATLNFPADIAVSSSGEIYIADCYNHVVRKIDVAGMISTVAGTGTEGSSPNGTSARNARLSLPQGVALDGATNTLYIADTWNHVLKKVKNP